eukprot:c17428_g1_i1.p1 GENE.c17428_g1_i1~~c17428_g1_i1.p1  ORF type:complete len:105 (+),score=26.25 c17428_g1_i1:447-761(+)
MQRTVSYLAKLQSIPEHHKSPLIDPNSDWISEDTLWSDVLSSPIEEDLTLHDDHSDGPEFDPEFALPTFLRPKSAKCHSIALQRTFVAFLGAVALILVDLPWPV